jgi:energy-coupling factor transport system ATP-binding protein
MSERVGFVFQNPEHQFVTHTVRDELAYGLHSRGLDRDEISARVDDVLARFDLASAADVSPFLLSGGQKRRLSVGTALVGGASVLVLDEPTFGQDRANAEELLGLLASLHRGGTTVVIVTHDLQLVAEFASRVVVMAEGRVLAHDTTEAVLRDETLLERAGLRLPPLAHAMRLLRRHPEWREVTRLAHLPSGDGA